MTDKNSIGEKCGLGLPAEQSTLHLGGQQVIMGQLSAVGLCRRNTAPLAEEYGGLREVSLLRELLIRHAR
jgi:hypothetical protein